MMTRDLVACCCLLLLSTPPLVAQEPAEEAARLTIADVFELPDKIRPDVAPNRGWLDGNTWIAFDSLNDPEEGKEADRQLVTVEARSGRKQPLHDRQQMARALDALDGISAAQARLWSRKGDYHFSAAHDAVLLNEVDDLFFYRFGSDSAHRLTDGPDEEVGETISPDGKLVAYIHDYDLHVVGADGGVPRALTSGGDENNLMGRLDWVYQEEVYGRGNWQAYWWSPDSQRLVFLALDETPVPEYTIVDHRKTRPDVEVWRYPKAGDPNPTVRVGVVDVAGGPVRWIDLDRYAHSEFLVVRAGWTPDSEQVVLQVQDRIQTWLDLVVADPESGESKVLFRDQTGVWIEPSDAPFWTDDGQQFVWLSERSGFRHLYLYERGGALVRQLTSGDWEVDTVHGIEETPKRAAQVWFSGDVEDVKGQKLFKVPLLGGELVRITSADGTHRVSASPTLQLFLDTYSSILDPGHVEVLDQEGMTLRRVAEGTRVPLKKYQLAPVEFVEVETRDGFPMEAMLIRPNDFDPEKTYPVFSYTYGGPHAPQVRDRYLNRSVLWHHLLAQHGYLVWICDNRSASGKGLQSVKGVYKNLGAQELADLEDGLDWLVGQGYADPQRIGLFGWSYGGYMTAYALTHSKKFKVGIAGAPVTDWRYYDTIYTERYMDTPQNNPQGYESSSVVKAAADLSGQLLLIHGMIDENVHLQNSMRFAEALQRAGKQFDLMLYPGNRHGIADKQQRQHLYEMMTGYILEHL